MPDLHLDPPTDTNSKSSSSLNGLAPTLLSPSDGQLLVEETTVRRDIVTLRRLARTVGATAVDEGLAALNKRLDQRTLTVLVIGEFNRGKSALINSLLDQTWLPTGTVPTTKAVTELHYGTDERIELSFTGGIRQPLDCETYRSLLSTNNLYAPGDATSQSNPLNLTMHHNLDLEHVDITLHHPMLQRITFIDTPGLNDPDNIQVDIIYGLLPRCDVALFVLDSSFALSLSERAIISDKLLSSSLSRLIFVLNKADQLGGSAEETEIVERATALLEPVLGRPPLILPYSAREVLRGEKNSRNDSLLALLTEQLPAGQSSLLLNSARGKLRAAAYALREIIRFRQDHLVSTVADLDRDLAALAEQEEGMRTRTTTTLDGLSHQMITLKDDYLTGLRGLANSLSAILPDEIRSIDMDDVRRYLPFYVQDTFRWHLEDTLPRLTSSVEAACRDAAHSLHDLLPQLPSGLAALSDFSPQPINSKIAPDLWDQGLVLSVFVGGVGMLLNPLLASALLVGGPAIRLFSFKARQAKERETLIDDARRAVTATADAVSTSVEKAITALELEIRERIDTALTTHIATLRTTLEDLRTRRESGQATAQSQQTELTTMLSQLAHME